MTGGIFVLIFRKWFRYLPLRRRVKRLIFMPCHMALNWTTTLPEV
nr:MAG TPA: hypothetical protein [Caudoviricetes sp.]